MSEPVIDIERVVREVLAELGGAQARRTAMRTPRDCGRGRELAATHTLPGPQSRRR